MKKFVGRSLVWYISPADARGPLEDILPKNFTGTVFWDSYMSDLSGAWVNFVDGLRHEELGYAVKFTTHFLSDGTPGAYWLKGKHYEKEAYWKKVWEIHKDNPEKARIIAAHLLAKK